MSGFNVDATFLKIGAIAAGVALLGCGYLIAKVFG